MNDFYHLRMYLLPRRDDTKILAECAAQAKIEWTPPRIRDDPAGLFNQEQPWRVILYKSERNTSLLAIDQQRRLVCANHIRAEVFSWYPPPPLPPWRATGNLL